MSSVEPRGTVEVDGNGPDHQKKGRQSVATGTEEVNIRNDNEFSNEIGQI